MIYSVYNHESRRFDYYQAQGSCPPHGWFRKPTPGALRQPEELAAKLPAGASLVGSGLLARGIIATDMPGVGTADSDVPSSGKETGLGEFGEPQRNAAARARLPANAVPNVAWDAASRGWDLR